MKKQLPNVTLIAYDNTDRPERTMAAVNRCMALCEFHDVVLVCREWPTNEDRNVTLCFVNDRGYYTSQFFDVRQMLDYVASDFALFVSHDGFIMNPEAWNDEWLDCDMIGAPWRPKDCSDHPNFRVGNTGFCLRSRKFMQATFSLYKDFSISDMSDVWSCRKMRSQIESFGVRYAPVETAAAFSWEWNIPEFPNGRPDAFGFHSFIAHPELAIPV